ncbi:MAG TPA: DUF1080 domain-containing protein [Bacteroidales bacterium]|nr:DUF1080 domain-containing protein [Bacteroidales bacterium]
MKTGCIAEQKLRKTYLKSVNVTLILLFCITSVYSGDRGGWLSLFNGKDLTGWHQLNGKADFKVEKGVLTGTMVANTPNSFLVADNEYSDFILELDLLADEGMNSGIQLRSISKPEIMGGRVHGYQCEVDATPRAWSGGIYDEARREWLYTGDLNPEGKKAFKQGKWNHYRIECIGTNIRTWINGKPVAWVIDDMDSRGLIALQVHAVTAEAGPGSKIRWKNIRIKTTNLQADLSPGIFIVNLIPNTLSEAEEAEGWKLLFDGKTTNGWITPGNDKFPSEGWKITDGVITTVPNRPDNPVRGSDIVSEEKFGAFELQFEFNFTEGSNSGVKYCIGNGGPGIGLEYQILDDQRHPDAKAGVDGNRTLASLYDLIPAKKQARFTKGPDNWSSGRIVLYPDNRVEHWLNGIKVLEYVRGSEAYLLLVSKSKYADYKDFGMVKESPVLLQYHQDEVKFRSIKIRKL